MTSSRNGLFGCEPAPVEEHDGTVIQSGEALVQARAASRQEKPELPGYTLGRRLGQGSFGEVWAAVQTSTGQSVAIKFFLDRTRSDLSYIRRELDRLREVSHHPAVVGLIDADLENATPYFVMPLLTRSLADELERPQPAIAVSWLRQLASGLQHSHEKGLLHCDLKPSNLMLDEAGMVRLVDFGQSRQQGDGVVAWGTLGYMAPEQAQLGSEKVHSSPNVRWDVYGLGATFYRLLTGRYPYWSDEDLSRLAGESLNARLSLYRRGILDRSLIPIRRLNPAVDESLADILEACLRPEPERRVASMTALLEDLRRRENRELLLCRQPWAVGYRMRTLLRRPAVLVGTLSALLLIGGATYSYVRLDAAHQLQTRRLSDLTVQRAVRAQEDDKTEEATLWWTEALALTPEDDALRARLGHARYALDDVSDNYKAVYWPIPGRPELLVTGEADGPQTALDGQRDKLALPPESQLVSMHPNLPRGAFRTSSEVLVYDFARKSVAWRFPVSSNVVDVSWNGADDLTVLQHGLGAWRQTVGARSAIPHLGRSSDRVSLSPDGAWARVDSGETARLVRLRDGQTRPLASEQTKDDVWFSPGSRWLVTDWDHHPVFVTLRAGENDWRPASPGIFGCYVDDARVALRNGTQVYVERVGEPDGARRFDHDAHVKSVCSFGRYLLTLTSAGEMHLWDLESGQKIITKALAGPDETIGFNGDGTRFFGCDSTQQRAWRLDPPTPSWTALPNMQLQDLGWGPEQTWLAALNSDEWWVLGDDGKVVSHQPWPTRVHSWSLGSRGMLVAEFASSLRLYNLNDKGAETVLQEHASTEFDGFARRVAFSADGRWLAGCSPGKVRVWQVDGGKPALRAEFPGPKDIRALALSSAGQEVATLTEDQFCLWSTTTGQRLSAHPVDAANPPQELRFAGSRVFGRAGGDLWVQDVGHKELSVRRKLQGSIDPDRFAALAPDRVLVAALDGIHQLNFPGLQSVTPLIPDVGVSHMVFDDPGRLWLSSDLADTRLWSRDQSTPFQAGLGVAQVSCALFGGGSRSVVVAPAGGGLRSYPLPRVTGSLEEIRKHFQAATGYRLDETGSLRPLRRAEWLELRRGI